MEDVKLIEVISYIEQYRKARKLLLKHLSPEEVSLMTDDEVCDRIQTIYNVVTFTDNSVLLVKKEDMDRFNQIAVWIDRNQEKA